IEVDAAAVVRGPSSDGAGGVMMVQRRGRALPLLDLSRAIALSGTGEGRKAIVVRRGDQPVGFAVDRMLGQQEVVVRPLEDALVRVPGVSGATDLGDGRPTLVLDLVALSGAATVRP